MVKEEAIWIEKVIDKLDIKQAIDVLDVGSSTKAFRTEIQPYIDEYVFAPLRNKNNNIFYLDKKQDEGVDYVFDINTMSPDSLNRKFDLVFCCSLLEHVNDRSKMCRLLVSFLKSKGYLLVTVPEAYRYHPDPIDTMFRPRMNQLIKLFNGFDDFDVIEQKVVVINEKQRYLKGIKEALRYKLPFLRWRINCLLLRKNK
ncbi:MAG: class I SAM-dependent methyltransferase [Candidatus Omnitrophica bacterium]|nr:class I SAM-dependent methyltransferase [Candidatus Omnitrophota bacterium]